MNGTGTEQVVLQVGPTSGGGFTLMWQSNSNEAALDKVLGR
jgi:hypothetical protein